MSASPFEAAAERVAAGADHHGEAAALVGEMTVDEKLGCLDGDLPFWPGVIDMTGGGYHRHTWPAAQVDRLGIPGLRFADGPRGCVIGRATAFPVSMARGATFDPDLEVAVGRAIGAELRASGATYTGAVCMNLLRHPAWGRAQETYGEDPHHVGEMAAAFTRGLQEHVMACMKHFACNSMENARFKVDVTADDRTLHEVYLPHFRRVAAEGVASVMSAYNSVNGEWCGENRELLIDILRDEWGWDGYVTSDFIFGLRDPVKSVEAGLNIEMPFSQQRATSLADALDEGTLSITDVDARVTETVATFLRFAPVFAAKPSMDVVACDAHRRLARRVAQQSIVLLRNEGGILPLDPSTRLAVVGTLAGIENLGDRGSSNVYPPEVSVPLDALRDAFASVISVADPSEVAHADVALVIVGTTWVDEGEYIDDGESGRLASQLFPPADHPDVGFERELRLPDPVFDDPPTPAGQASGEGFAGSLGGDRSTLRLSDSDVELIRATVDANPRTVVAVMGGSAFVMDWLEDPAAALMLWYPGMEGGRALADVLTGEVDPGGRLPFAVPRNESDLVAFDPEASTETYGLLHGQWLLDHEGTEPHLPFGHGLSYTSFSIDSVTIDAEDHGRASATATVRNEGDRTGSTVLYVYGQLTESRYLRPPRRLVGFARVTLDPDSEAAITIALDLGALEVRSDRAWHFEPGTYRFTAGQHAGDPAAVSDIRLS